ncbi:MAG: alpha/beta hydrolase [Treponema sp.]|jgi:pimeloyl-ACP methyl ester carboxylesterase|nr:alpha/beta hydrolase [Treponema sp.]
MGKTDAPAGEAPFKPWPGLGAWGRNLVLAGGNGELFYYDVPAAVKRDGGNTAAAGQNASAGFAAGRAQNGSPVLVLIHGLGDEADSWRHIIPRLSAAGCRSLAPDLPGFGRSAVRGRINLDRHAALLLSFMQETGAASPGRPAALAGNSLGAVIAELAASRRPDLVKALILIDGCFPLSGGPDRGLLLMGLPFIGKRWYRAFRKDHGGAWKSLYPYYHNLDGMDRADKEFLRERVIDRVESAGQERAYFASLRSMNMLSLFGGAALSFAVRIFPGKILLLWGSEDRIVPENRTAEFRSLRGDAELRIIKKAGHLPHQEKPEETADEMLRFLAGVNNGG